MECNCMIQTITIKSFQEKKQRCQNCDNKLYVTQISEKQAEKMMDIENYETGVLGPVGKNWLLSFWKQKGYIKQFQKETKS